MQAFCIVLVKMYGLESSDDPTQKAAMKGGFLNKIEPEQKRLGAFGLGNPAWHPDLLQTAKHLKLNQQHVGNAVSTPCALAINSTVH